ncbi:MAG TPA: restriction endonuclease [Methanocella sp.]|nr:restriction endonuclease [Methanocella sp.]
MTNNLLDVIKEIFSTYSYSVSASEDFDLIAEKPNNNLAIRVFDSPNTDDIKQFAEKAKGGNAKGLIVSMAFFTEDAKKVARQKDLMVWDRPELERQIGKAVLVRLGGDWDLFAASEGGAVPPGERDLPVSALTKELYSSAPELLRARTRAAKAAEHIEELAPDSIVENGKETAVASDEEPAEPIKLQIQAIPIKVKDSDAIKISSNIGRADDVEISINFIPYWKYSYSLDVISRYKDVSVPLNGKGSRMINAINKNVDSAPTVKLLDGVDIPDTPYNVSQAVITEEEARTMAMKAIIHEHSKEVRFKGTQGEAAFVEHKKFAPKNTDVKMTMQLLYVPFWVVRSHRGYIEINAYDGKPARTPMDDGAEIL